MRSRPFLVAALVVCSSPCRTFAVEPPLEPSPVPTVSTGRPPIGHTVALPPTFPLLPAPKRPAAVQVSVSPLVAPVGGTVAVTATVADQYGAPVPDGTTVVFSVGAGTLQADRGTTDHGRAKTEVTVTTEGPLRVNAGCGFVEAVAFVHGRSAGSVAGAGLVDDDLTAGPGLGDSLGSMQTRLGTGVLLEPGSSGRQGLRYRLGGLTAGSVTFRLVGFRTAGRVEGLFCLSTERNGTETPIADLRRGRGQGVERWSLRRVDASENARDRRNRADSPALEAAVSYDVTVAWQGRTVQATCRPAGGQPVVSLELRAEQPLPPVTSVVVGGHPAMPGPAGVTVQRVAIVGR